MTTSTSIIAGTCTMIIIMALAWEWVRRTKNGGLADVVWTFGLGGVAIFFCFANSDGVMARQVLAASIMFLWTLRLGVGLWRRNVGGHEDVRYTEFRKKWGDTFMPRLFALLMIQAVAAIILSLGVMLAASNPNTIGMVDGVATLWMLAALGGSLVSDQQLAHFKKDQANRGKICDTGLWARSRHPNYFFETMFWAGWPILALAGGWVYGLFGFAALAFIYWLLRYVSGEPMLEELMARNYGEAFANYCRRVPPFFPRLLR